MVIQRKSKFTSLILVITFILNMLCCLPSFAANSVQSGISGTPKNIILLIGDGMGFEHMKAARDSVGGHVYMDDVNDATGEVTTHSANASITDSSSAATAIASGYKINNNVLGLLPDGTSVPTVLELAEDKGLATGLVTTTQIAHATPAGFASHVTHRNQFNKITAQYFDNFAAKGNPIEVLMGGGQENFDDRAAYYNRTGKSSGDDNDTRDLLGEFVAQGYQYAGNASDLSSASGNKLLGLFHPNNGLAQEVDRPAGCTEPHLVDMTAKAMEVLAKDSDGFFLMVEGGQIDWASHANDFDNNIGETVAFDDAVKAALDFQTTHPDTLIIVTADHETGGLTYNGPGNYSWSSGDHTAAMVPIMAEGPGAELFSGAFDNTDIARKIAQLINLDKPLVLQHADAAAGQPTGFTVTSMGLPVADAKVTVKKGVNNTLATLTTDGSGQVSYTFKDAGDYSVFVTKEGYSDSGLITLSIGTATTGATISDLSVLDGNQQPVSGALTHGTQYYLKWKARKNSDGSLPGLAIVEALYGSQPVFLNAASLQVAGGQDTEYSVLFQPSASGAYTIKGLYWSGWSNSASWQSLADPVEASINVN
jgi:alkaline phosphatase